MNLNFESTSISLSSGLKAIDDTALPADNFDTIAGTDYVVYLNLNVSGSINLNFGSAKVFGAAVTVNRIVGADGQPISTSSGDGADIVAQLAVMKVVGFELEARRNNENKRTQGLQVST